MSSQDELQTWDHLFREQAKAEAAGAPYGRCAESNHDEADGFRDDGPACGAALLPATENPEGRYCVACLYRGARDYGEDG